MKDEQRKQINLAAIKDGTVIDHIPSNVTFDVAEILNVKSIRSVISVATFLSSKKMGTKGIIKIEGKNLTQDEVNKITIVAPDATVNIIKNYEVEKKLKVTIPKIINKVVKCSNPNCITNNEKVETIFYVMAQNPLKLKCHYCERFMNKEDIILS